MIEVSMHGGRVRRGSPTLKHWDTTGCWFIVSHEFMIEKHLAGWLRNKKKVNPI